ncbi:glycine cleavage system regulatory protein [Vibrio mimicus VM223]|nr:glycine cleavage system regulatory protein [Vibrio mimicus VM223]
MNFIEDSVAAVIKIELPKGNAGTVKEAFQSFPGLLVEITDSDPHVHKSDTVYQIRLDANDRAGIVNEITHLLDGQGISILDMDCQRVFIAGGGGISSSLFTANVAMRLPVNTEIDDVVKELEALSEDTRVTLEA